MDIIDNLLRLLRLLTVGGAFGAMGLMKLAGTPWERRWFARWGRDDDTRQAFGALETGAALLLVPRETRRIGALALAASSIKTVDWEAESGDELLAAARFGLLVLAIGVAFGRR